MLTISEEQSMLFPFYQEVFDDASPGKQKEIQEPDPTYEEKMVCSGYMNRVYNDNFLLDDWMYLTSMFDFYNWGTDIQ